MTPPVRYGITIPFAGVPLAEHRAWLEEVAFLGYSDVWSAEATAHDGFTPLALAAAWAPALRLGVAIVPAFTRGPALLAQSLASLCEAAPGRVAFGIGTSSNVIVERWNGIAFDKPYQRVRDTIEFLRLAFSGEKVTRDFETFRVADFRLRVDAELPPILVGALRPGMLRLAGRHGDGAITNWLSPHDVPKITSEVGGGKEIVARVFVIPTDDRATVDFIGRRAIAEYLNVPVYAEYQRWLGRAEALDEMWRAWAAGDRKAATAAIPESVLHELLVFGTVPEMRERLGAYRDAGVTTLAPMLLCTPDDARTALRDLAPPYP